MNSSGKPKISVVITVLNEQSTIRRLITALKRQTIKNFETIIVDGGSADNTVKILKKYKFVKIYQIIGNRSVGRNYGVSKSRGQIIAFTDAGCLPHPDWLEKLTAPFADQSVSVVSGFYQGLAKNIFQKCLIPYVLVMPDKADQTEFFPATRSMAIRKSVFIRSGGFNENLSHNEDYAFAHHLKNIGLRFTFAKDAVVDWLPRQNLKQAAWMFTRFAIGDIQAGIIRPQLKPLAIRYLIFLYLVFLTPHFHFLLYVIFVSVFCYSIFAIFKNYRYVRDIRAFFWLPVLQVTCDLSILFGSLVGFLSRIWT